MKIYIRAASGSGQISPGSLSPGQLVKDMSELHPQVVVVKSVEDLGRGLYSVKFEDGSEGTYDANDKFELVDRPEGDTYTYRNLYDLVIKSSDYTLKTRQDKVVRLAQLIFRRGYEGRTDYSEEDSVVFALELYEDMTGIYWDPTREEFDDMVYSVY